MRPPSLKNFLGNFLGLKMPPDGPGGYPPNRLSRTSYYYGNGQGVPKDYAEAVKWFRKAAEQNYPDAQNNLGFCYANGVGVPKDYVEAYKWMLLTAAQGKQFAAKTVAALGLPGFRQFFGRF